MTVALRTALLASVLLPATAFAQDAAPASEGLGDIVVTARKVEERLQEVPVAITAFGTQEIQSARIESIADVAKLTPGLNFTPLFGRQNQLPIIRGAAQTFGELNVGVFLDGVYLSGKAAVDLELNDLERVEVVKGPQSALYGRNTFAGAINYVTKRPSDEFGGYLEGTAGTNGLKKVRATVTGPLAEGVTFRAGAFYRDFDGFYTSAIDGGRVDYAESYGFTGTLEFEPTDTLRITLRGTYSNDDLGQPPSNVIRTNAFPGRPSGIPTLPIRNLLYIGEVPSIPRNGVTVNTRLPAFTSPVPIAEYGDSEKALRFSGTIEQDFDGIILTSITSYFERKYDYTFDGDNTICDQPGVCPNFGPPIANGTSQLALSSERGKFRDFSQEIRLQSDNDGPLSWLVGVFYYDNRINGVQRSIAPTTTAASTFGFPNIITTTKAYSAFASVGYEVTEALKVTGELRYEYEKKRFRQNPLRTADDGATSGTTTFNLSDNFEFWTPRFIVSYQASPDKLVYASYARGAKTGGFNTGLNITAAQRQYEPEYTNNYEIGFKTDWLDRNLRINLAGYYTDWNDQQAACQNPGMGLSTQRTYTCNVASSEIYGAELEVIARFSEMFTVSGSYTYTHARYQSFVDDSLAAVLGVIGSSAPVVDFDGKRLPYVPDHKIVVSPRLNFPLDDRVDLEARVDVQYQSRTYVRADNLQNFGEKTTVDLRMTGRSGPMSVQFFVNNLLDNKRPVAGVRFFDSVNFSVASPLVQGADRRQIGMTIGYNF